MRPITRPYQIRENFERACDFTMFKIIDFERQAKARLSIDPPFHSTQRFQIRNSLYYVTLCYNIMRSTTK